MSRAVKDADLNQRRAADPANSVFVTANAGSGKTKVLVDRIARLLLQGSRPSAFLCITYTKAAAAEMQRRLFERLGAWCVADDDTLRAQLEDLGAGDADLARARALFAQALETPGGLKIQTIHAFCERLLARFPLEARVAPGFDIADEPRAAALLSRARAEAALAPDAPRDAFRRFAGQMSGDALDGLLDRLALRRAEFHRYAQRSRGHAFADADIRHRHGAHTDAATFCARAVADLNLDGAREIAAAMRAGSPRDCGWADRLTVAVDLAGGGAAPRTVLEACFDAAFTGEGKPYKQLVTADLKKAQAWIEPRLRTFVDFCVGARERLNAIDRAEDAMAALALALKLDQAYQDAKHESGVLDFDDLIEHAHHLLSSSQAAPWVLYKLDGGLDHILIDEGQDTSPTQWDLIAPLQQEFFAGHGARARHRTMFAVGDPKQSIYAFQGADPRRFMEENKALAKRAAAAGRAFVGPELRTSFRSAPEIMRVVDETFADKPLIAAAPGRHDVIKHLASRTDAFGCVEVWPFTPRRAAEDARAWDAPLDVETETTASAQLAKALAQRVREMIDAREAVWDKDTKAPRPMRAGDVLALVRKRGAMFRDLIKAFKRAGLPVAGADRMTLRDELAVEDCLALMRVALDPADDLSLACVLKGPWCNLDDDDHDLFPLAHGRAKGETLYRRLLTSAEPRTAEAKAFIGDVIARAGASAFDFLSWALETPHHGAATGWSRVFARLGHEARDPLEELLQRALKPSPHAAPTLQRFLYEIEVDAGQVKRELEAETGAIRVMTVHGAKGLEAPIVILPDSTGEADDKPENGLMFDDAGAPFVSFRGRDDDAQVAAARAEHKARVLSEHWRLLYVALTRARDRLIVCGAQHRHGEAEESWRRAVEEALVRLDATPVETPFGEGLRVGAPVMASADAVVITSHAPKAAPLWVHELAPGAARVAIAAPSRIAQVDASLFSPRGDGQKRFRRGRLIHGLLQRLPDIDVGAREAAARAWLKRQDATDEESAVLAAEALSVIADARFAPVFGPKSRAEAPIIGEIDGKAVRGVVDRLVVDDDRVIVLDFKTDRPAPTDPDKTSETYVLQMALYQEVLRRIFPDKAVSCALLWTEAPHLMDLPQGRLDAAFAAYSGG